MSKIRVHELAKELDISSKDLIDLLLKEFDITVKNHMSTIEDEDAALIKEFFADNDKNDFISTGEDKKEDIVEVYEEILNDSVKEKKARKVKNKVVSEEEDNSVPIIPLAPTETVEMNDTITVKDLSEKLSKSTVEVIRQLMFMGVMAGINQELDFETARKLAEKFEVTLIHIKENNESEFMEIDNEVVNEALLKKRSPVVTVMGHVDHGKTSLLDAIRKATVTETEAGGITQHIGAYVVNINGESITFLDTPGHEAFTAMRARGAQITDIVVLVVAADDGIMPQTEEAINHCKAANVPMIVAINKIDKPGANLDRVKQELTEHGLVAEDWGGDTICVPVSAKTKEGIDSLLEMIVLTSEIQELTADATRKAKGAVIESKLDKGRGPVASLLVQNGTLHTGDSILVGSTYGRIRAMFDDKGKKIKTAGPSVPVEILGLSEVPAAGDKFNVIKDEKTAREMADKRKDKLRTSYLNANHKVSLEDLYKQIQEGTVKELNIIIKADVQGSIEALKQSLEKLSIESVKVRVIHGAVGAITETDVTLASASNAIIIGFNVRPNDNATAIAEKESVEMKTYRIIYNAIDDVKAAMIGMLEPVFKEVIVGKVEIREVYKISSIGTVAGSYVLDGKITRNSTIRIIRDGIVILEGNLASLKRFKDDAKEVLAGFECGLTIEKFNDIKEGDILEVFAMEEIKPKAL
ncbi:translation initiation factor IF-2 [Clostridium akagii]|uniref:translation initiation factor IF-2 n=1 Tax=Clostridium akagii TaxID=91623 RepID=UPI0004790C7B|nr:translation initiation factor IF-2 [Clostridium akagii]